jgi:hypothetical protein
LLRNLLDFGLANLCLNGFCGLGVFTRIIALWATTAVRLLTCIVRILGALVLALRSIALTRV